MIVRFESFLERQDLKGLLGDMVMRLVSAVRTVDELRKLPADSFFVTVNGKVVEWQQLDAGVSFEVHIRLRGGKGGFGSLLRSFRIHRSTNQLMCRDLTGRRLADVKEEEKLRKWIERANEREELKRKRRQEKYEKLKAGPPKHDFNDSKYIETREKLLDQTDDAFEAGLTMLSEAKSTGHYSRKKPIEESEEDDGENSEEDVPGPSGLGSKKKLDRESPELKKPKLIDDKQKTNVKEKNKVQQAPEEQSNEPSEKNAALTNGSDVKESGGEKNSNTSASNGSVRSTCEKEAIEYTSVNLDEYDSADALCSLGLNHLKHALEVRGLKCGGSLAERAARLFSVRGLAPDQYPKSARASSLKKAT
ncbi:Protein SDE2 -like protein [Toxocara canis]|uniref:Protein SDE2-like protein n=1 Tax=Toxocara canis TaxID=6265 RepID=A0A0B2V5L7_TOXCA|nr:Protein SDE2 -like protein [Toxocara canis]